MQLCSAVLEDEDDRNGRRKNDLRVMDVDNDDADCPFDCEDITEDEEEAVEAGFLSVMIEREKRSELKWSHDAWVVPDPFARSTNNPSLESNSGGRIEIASRDLRNENTRLGDGVSALVAVESVVG